MRPYQIHRHGVANTHTHALTANGNVHTIIIFSLLTHEYLRHILGENIQFQLYRCESNIHFRCITINFRTRLFRLCVIRMGVILP